MKANKDLNLVHMITCPICQRIVEDDMEHCPFCGPMVGCWTAKNGWNFPMRIDKTRFIGLMIIIALLALFWCYIIARCLHILRVESGM